MNALRTLGPTMVVLALGLAEAAAAPIPLSTCQAIDKLGSYLVNHNGGTGITALSGSEVSESMAHKNDVYGIRVSCPGNAIANTATGNTLGNLLLIGAGCNAPQNDAP